ncbi:hypothetical protein N7462_004917 [Penicillium macrosclerotiorum]|uniref:uncharacterized protein n=1 Tax=Penicillium macrosclerotiorum TaxID=303699 RepID=UPI0025468FEE|nr:uncharacterized protein N7462_004917 [Penicillium macrosclerotiorum]KAJ5690525.1 hypothetical protein N7462_004917 [Penicillium macrosclerotiorum]
MSQPGSSPISRSSMLDSQIRRKHVGNGSSPRIPSMWRNPTPHDQYPAYRPLPASLIAGRTLTEQPQELDGRPIPQTSAQYHAEPERFQWQPEQQASGPGIPAGYVLVPQCIGQWQSAYFPTPDGQYQVRVVSYLEALIPIAPGQAQQPPES